MESLTLHQPGPAAKFVVEETVKSVSRDICVPTSTNRSHELNAGSPKLTVSAFWPESITSKAFSIKKNLHHYIDVPEDFELGTSVIGAAKTFIEMIAVSYYDHWQRWQCFNLRGSNCMVLCS